MTITNAPTTLAPSTRYITTHDPSGKSIIHSSPAHIYHGREGAGGMARSYAFETVPVKLSNDEDIEGYLSSDPKASITSHLATDIVIPNGKGVMVACGDFDPGGESQMHRTVSVDVVVCVLGVIEMELDGGERVTLRPGDHVIQRGTMHKWYNPSQTEPARFVGLTLACEPFEIAGKPLEETHVAGTGALKKDGSRR